MIITHLDAFVFEQTFLSVGSAEGKGRGEAAGPVNHPVAGDYARLGVDMQRIAHDARGFGVPGKSGDHSVGGDAPLGYGLDGLIYAGIKGFVHRQSPPVGS